MVVVKIRTIDKTGSIVDAVTEAGGDLIRVNGIYFSVDQPDKYYSQARTSAMADAKAKATQLAGLAGITVGKATFVSEDFYSSSVLIRWQPTGIPQARDIALLSVPVKRTLF